MEEYRKAEKLLLVISQQIGVPELTEVAIQAHTAAIVDQVNEPMYIEPIYIKKFMGSTYRVPKKPKQKQKQKQKSVAAISTTVSTEVTTPTFNPFRI